MKKNHTKQVAAGALLAVAIVLVALFPAGAAAVTANDSNYTQMYNNSSTDVANESWTEGHRDPTLANYTHYLTRVGGFIIGDGGDAQGGGSANGMIVGLLFMGAFGAVAIGGRFGSVGGSVLGIVGVAGLVSSAIAPAWIYPVLLFILGGLLSLVAIRVWR